MAGSGTKWLKYGCLGCLGLVAVLVLACAALLTVVWMGVRSEQVEHRVLTPEIPSAPPAEPAPAGGRIFIDVSSAELIVEPAGPGEALRVEGTYDASSFVLEESLEPGATDGEPWSYRVTFHRTAGGGGWTVGLKQLLGGSQPTVTVYLPADVPVDLGIDLKQGGASARLGGLWLRSADVVFAQGGVDLRIDEPLRRPAERMSIRGSMGGAYLGGLGNASPRSLDVAYSMGGMQIDLRGRWLNDSDITIDGSMGGGSVWLPRGVRFEGIDRGGIEAPVEPEIPPPTLRFRATSAMGELQFID